MIVIVSGISAVSGVRGSVAIGVKRVRVVIVKVVGFGAFG